jgi:prolipoprotein diacylglyceryl transferase
VTDAVSYLAAIPSPTQGVWYLGPIPIRAYALCILVGIIAACAIAEVRLRQRGAPKWLVLDIAVWAVPFGIVGGRLYHVITSPDAYFGKGGQPLKAFAIWEGGLGIWGAIALGAVGAMIACRRLGVPLTFFADAVAPGLPVAQAIGRLGNWFNNELYGGHTSLPWGLTVYDFNLGTGKAATNANGEPIEIPGGPFQPTFLYELVWNLGVGLLVYLVDRRWKLGKGRAFALYVMAYTVGRFWIEALRTDAAHEFFGVRVNSWMSIIVFLGALAYFLRVKGPQQHVKVDDEGKLHLVTADGTPIAWNAPVSVPAFEAASADSAASPPDGESAASPPHGDSAAGDEPADSPPDGASAAAADGADAADDAADDKVHEDVGAAPTEKK